MKGQLALLERPRSPSSAPATPPPPPAASRAAWAQALGEAGQALVSGLARGIDSAVHDGSLDTGTIAVIAGGIDIVYPPENEARQQAIAERGLLVAEQPPGVEPRARHFPYRNRIIAGLAAGTVVVEAAPNSGSLITARYAGEFGRDVMAIPGSPLDPRAQGCNRLIRDGAILVQNAEDVLETVRPFGGVRRVKRATGGTSTRARCRRKRADGGYVAAQRHRGAGRRDRAPVGPSIGAGADRPARTGAGGPARAPCGQQGEA